MRHSSERILTTHTGSLPRPKGLTELVFRKQEGKDVDAATFEAAAFEATNDVTRVHLQRRRELPLSAYEAYLEAVTAAMALEYKAIVDAGFILQLDCPDLPMAAHTAFWAVEHMEEMGFKRYIELHIDALNQSIADLPAVRVRCICAGATTRARTPPTCRSSGCSTW